MLKAWLDRHRCVGAGNCITIAPTAFDWIEGDFAKADVLDVTTIDEEQLREAALSCPTQAIRIEEVDELLPWQLRGKSAPSRVQKTFVFADIVKSSNLVEALGDEAWQALLRWHDETLRSQFSAHHGQEVVVTGDGFFVAFDSPDDALACAVAIQRTGRASADRRVRSSGPDRSARCRSHPGGGNFTGKGVHEAARIAASQRVGRSWRAARPRPAEGSRPPSPRRSISEGCRSRSRSSPLSGASRPMDVDTPAIRAVSGSEELGPVAVIGEVNFVDMRPKTRIGKVVRRVLQAVVTDAEPGDVTAIEDEASVEEAREAWQEMRAAVQGGTQTNYA